MATNQHIQKAGQTKFDFGCSTSSKNNNNNNENHKMAKLIGKWNGHVHPMNADPAFHSRWFCAGTKKCETNGKNLNSTSVQCVHHYSLSQHNTSGQATMMMSSKDKWTLITRCFCELRNECNQRMQRTRVDQHWAVNHHHQSSSSHKWPNSSSSQQHNGTYSRSLTQQTIKRRVKWVSAKLLDDQSLWREKKKV